MVHKYSDGMLIGEGGKSSVYYQGGTNTVIKKCDESYNDNDTNLNFTYIDEYKILDDLNKKGSKVTPKPIKYISDYEIEVEYIDGRLFSEIVEDNIEEAFNLMPTVLDAVLEVMDLGYLVDDIHSDNVIISEDKKCYLIDVDAFKLNTKGIKDILGMYLELEVKDYYNEIQDNISIENGSDENTYEKTNDRLTEITMQLGEQALKRGYILESW